MRIRFFSLYTVLAALLCLPLLASAQLTVQNGADIDMTGSTGSVIVFPDGTQQSTAQIAGPEGQAGADGSDANVPAGHGGTGNTVSGTYAFVGGGGANTASAYSATVGGGYSNTASDPFATVAGGSSNTASSHYATVSGGKLNTASGVWAAVGGGYRNAAAGDFSFAAGRRAKINALHDGVFLFADSTDADFTSLLANEFAVRATGGVRLLSSSLGAGVWLPPGGTSWSSSSDREAKEHFSDVDSVEILDKLAAMPIQHWNYKNQDESVRHIGPVAQDFHAAFGLNGEYNGGISTQDFDGVALAAIQGVNKRLAAELALRDKQLAEKGAQIAALIQRLDALEARLAER